MLAALATAAYAFSVQTVPGTDQPVFWGVMPVDFAFVDDTRLPPGGSSAVARAFESWSGVDGTRAGFTAQTSIDALPTVSRDDHHVVFLAQEWPYGESALAIASVWSNEQTGELVHFDIRVNPTVDWAIDGDLDCFDLESAVTHEVGHVLGLEHSDLDEATMFSVLSPGHVRRGLHDDDEEGLRFLYPEEDQQAAACSTLPGSTGALGFGFALMALGRRRSVR